ncbi:hypothetical protein BDV98DRAFT_595265 [Pterulicium gracile]|uniref:DUF6534 domain-containing protein n=1 Tax=Pterulicium gracile TaxID=1884261 RepID=A0A5C3QBH8_9AGAR|nr:hypothetical protein BDV98DRAFT_595265 [Pterula gracilis]
MLTCRIKAFYAYRIRTLSRRWWPLIPVVILIPARIVDGIYVTVRMLAAGSLSTFEVSGDKWLCILNLAIKLALDLYSTVCLCWLLFQWRGKGIKQTQELVQRLVVWTAEVGLLNSILAFAMLVMMLTMDNSVFFS